MKKKCETWEWDKNEECGLVGKYECENCGMVFCKKHEKAGYGECPECPPPRLIEIEE